MTSSYERMGLIIYPQKLKPTICSDYKMCREKKGVEIYIFGNSFQVIKFTGSKEETDWKQTDLHSKTLAKPWVIL